MIPNAFYYSYRAGVTNGKALACYPSKEALALYSSIKYCVTNDNVLLCSKVPRFGWVNGYFSTRQAFTNIVITTTLDL